MMRPAWLAAFVAGIWLSSFQLTDSLLFGAPKTTSKSKGLLDLDSILGTKDKSTGNKGSGSLLDVDVGLLNKDKSAGNKGSLLDVDVDLLNKDKSTGNKGLLNLDLGLGTKDKSTGKNGLLNLDLGLGTKDKSTGKNDNKYSFDSSDLDLDLGLGTKDKSTGKNDLWDFDLDFGTKDKSKGSKDSLEDALDNLLNTDSLDKALSSLLNNDKFDADLSKLWDDDILKANFNWKPSSDSKNKSLDTDDLLGLLKSTKRANKDSSATTDLINLIWGSLLGGGDFQAGKPCSVCGKSRPEYTALKTESLLYLKDCPICKKRKQGTKSILDAVVKQGENGNITKDIEDAIDELLNIKDGDLPREKKRPILKTLLGVDENFGLDGFDWEFELGDYEDTWRKTFNKIKQSDLNENTKRDVFDFLNIPLGSRGILDLDLDLSLDALLGKSCYDLDLSSSGESRTYKKVGCGCKKVKTISLNSEKSQNLCVAGKTYGYDGGQVFVSGGCRGNFKVCKNVDGQNQIEHLGTGRLNCSGIFTEAAGHCLYIETRNYKDYIDAVTACSEKGGRLVQIKDATSFLGSLSALSYLKGQSFHYGGFADLNLAPAGFFENLAIKYNVPVEEVHSNCGRFGQDRESFKSLWNSASVIASKCPRLDFGSNSNTMGSCSERQGFICEQIDKNNDNNARWTDWYSGSNNNTDGDEETLDGLLEAATNGLLGGLNTRLGINCLEMQCRAVGTTNLYNKDNTGGLVLSRPCERNAITCYNSEQENGVRCPDFEVRIQCPLNDLDDCSIDAVRKKCESKGQRCVATFLGAICKAVQTPRTGNEEDDSDHVTVAGQNYKLHECSITGGLHYSTFDKARADIQIVGGLNLAGTSDNYVLNDLFPVFGSSIFFERLDSDDDASSISAIDLRIDGSIYSFTGNNLYLNGLERPILGYDDDVVGITAFQTGSSTRVNIATNFGVVIEWDQQIGITIKVPAIYGGALSGVCGNADLVSEDEFSIPGGSKDLTAFAKYHAVGSVAGKACEHKSWIPKDVSLGNITKFGDLSFCGVLSPDGAFGKSLLGLLFGSVKDIIKTALNDHLFDCIKDFSWLNYRFINRCGRIGHYITRNLDFLRLTNRTLLGELDKLWRTQSGCESPSCGQNQVYSPFFIPRRQRSIANLFADITSDDDRTTSGCGCSRGYLWDSNLACVPKKEADNTCLVELSAGKPSPLKNGETVVIQPCKKTAKCVNGSVVETDLEACSDNAECSKDGLRCICLTGFEGNGHTCYLNNKCKKSFTSFGTRCYKVTEKLTFSEASGFCDLEGARLAGSDDDDDNGLENYLRSIETPEAQAASRAKTVPFRCPLLGQCQMQRDKRILGCKSRDQRSSCSNLFEITEDRRSVKAGNCSDGNFLCDIIDDLFSFDTKTYRKFLIRGNTKILPPNTKLKLCKCNLQLPKQLDLTGLNGLTGCFYAGLDQNKKMIITPGADCEEKTYAICEYDNTDIDTFDPLDLKVLDRPVNRTEAAKLCELEDRKLLIINSTGVRDRARNLLSSLGISSAWHDFQRDLNTNEFKCGFCQHSGFDNWDLTSLSLFNDKDSLCSSVSSLTGKFTKERCSTKLNPICGPRVGKAEPTFSQAYSCNGISSLASLKGQLQREGREDFVCENPASVECTVEKLTGEHITVGTHNIGTYSAGAITCNTSTISCNSGMGLNCDTCKVRFLCIEERNECKELQKVGATPCLGGQICVPTQNGFWCRCPINYVWNNDTKICERYSPSCTLGQGLGPELIPFKGKELIFTSNCKQKLLGTPENLLYYSGPSFGIYSYHTPCLNSSGNCISKLSIELKNVKRHRCTCKGTQDFNIEVDLKADKYLINKNVFTKSMTESNFFSIESRKGYFSINLPSYGVAVVINDGLVRISAPDSKTNDKLDGLCVGSSSSTFRLSNGSTFDIGFAIPGFNTRLINYIKSWSVIDNDSPKCDDPKIIDPVVSDDCTKDKDLSQQLSACDIFKSPNSTLYSAFVETNQDWNYYFDKCIYEGCRTKNPGAAACSVAKVFTSRCAEMNYPIQYRTELFCHRNCKENEVYAIDASNEPACGVNPVFKRGFEHREEEGCRCIPGFKRLNGKCVPEKECGCTTERLNDVFPMALAVNESVYGAGCLEKDTCVLHSDGITSLETTFPVLPANSRCSIHAPFTVECIEGYRWVDEIVGCVAVPAACEEGFVNIFGKCVTVPSQTLPWKDSVDYCNSKDGVFIDVDKPGYKEVVENVLQETTVECVFAAGQVIVDKKDNRGGVRFKSCLTDREHEDKGWANFKPPLSLLDTLKLHKGVSASDVAVGSYLNIAFARVGDMVQAFAVLPGTKCGSICVFRNSSKDDLEYLEDCGNDDRMDDDGDVESSTDLHLNSACKICPRPKGVKCVLNPNRRNNGTISGDCLFNRLRASYVCPFGIFCQDKQLSILCDKDVDECATSRHTCGPNSQCVNTVGNYKCVCDKDYPVSVNGVCQREHTCSLTAFSDNNDFINNVVGFDGVAGIFNLNCKFKLLTYRNLAIGSNEAPLINIYVLNRVIEGKREPVVAGYHVNPATGDEFHFEFSRDSLLRGQILTGRNASALRLTSAVGTRDVGVGIDISSVQVGAVRIADIRNYYSLHITSVDNALKVEVTVTAPNRDSLGGVCASTPVNPGDVFDFSEEEIDEISVEQYAKCRKPVPTEHITTPAPVEIPSISPVPPVNPVSPPTDPTTHPSETCNIIYTSFCASLSRLFATPEAACLNHVCGGKVSKCTYLLLESFTVQATGSEIKALVDSECPNFCGVNQHLKLTLRSAQATCARPNRRFTLRENHNEDFIFACTCIDGLLFTGTECVPESQCGCVWDGVYHNIGDEWRSDDCSEVYTCKGNNKVDTREAPCGQNAYCSYTEEGPTCQCQDGFYGNPDCREGCAIGWEEGEGSKVCYNHSYCNGQSEVRCDCQKGFISNCDDCEDIDECKEGLHECNLTIHVCVNKRGGYSCDCYPGYTEKNGKCVDVDECSTATHNCTQGQGCVNRLGYFKCKCCAGYKPAKDSSDCERDTKSFPVLPKDPRCCHVCSNDKLCSETDSTPYCYFKKNGKKSDYKNYFTMYQDFCVNGLVFEKARFQIGKCSDFDKPVIKPEQPGQTTVPTSCQDLSLCASFPPPPALAKGPICGPESAAHPKTYPSFCDLIRDLCRSLDLPRLFQIGSSVKARPGSCNYKPPPSRPEKPSEPTFTPWHEYSPCITFDGVCGKGVQYRTRHVIPYDDGRWVREIAATEINQTRTCYEPCPHNPDNPESCPDKSFCDYFDPVCGVVGVGVAQQYTSECLLNIDACVRGVGQPQLLNLGQCDPDDDGQRGRLCSRGPINLSVKYDKEQDGEHCLGVPVTIGTCGDLLCEGGEHTCCRATEYEKIQITLSCISLSTGSINPSQTHVYLSATKCECQRKLSN